MVYAPPPLSQNWHLKIIPVNGLQVDGTNISGGPTFITKQHQISLLIALPKEITIRSDLLELDREGAGFLHLTIKLTFFLQIHYTLYEAP
jgi:hypothetical protein